MYSLEEDWTDIVRNSHMLSEKARSQQTALWELVETEVAYIRTLKVIQDVSKKPLLRPPNFTTDMFKMIQNSLKLFLI